MYEIHIHRQSWPLVLVSSSALIVFVLLYFRGWFRLRTVSHIEISRSRFAASLLGIVLAWISIASPVASLDHGSLTLHMLKHLLLMTVAAPLILAGSPGSVLAWGLSNRLIHGDGQLESRKLNAFHFSNTASVWCWLAGTATVIGWHLPAAFQLGMRSVWAHTIEDVSFLTAGLLFWWPIARSWSSTISEPRWDMALYLFLATLPCDILSAFLVFCNRVVYAHYVSAAQSFGASPLEDQERAGALMWVWVTFVYLIPAVGITLQILSPSDRASDAAVEDPAVLAAGPAVQTLSRARHSYERVN